MATPAHPKPTADQAVAEVVSNAGALTPEQARQLAGLLRQAREQEAVILPAAKRACVELRAELNALRATKGVK